MDILIYHTLILWVKQSHEIMFIVFLHWAPKCISSHLFVSYFRPQELKVDCISKGSSVEKFRLYMCQGVNSHYFHIIGDKLINPIVGAPIWPHYKDSVIKGWRFPIPKDQGVDRPWLIWNIPIFQG